MKRKLAMALTLIMLMALILPQTAFAATRHYLEMSFTETNPSKSSSHKGNYTVTYTSGTLSRTESLTGEVVLAIGANYTDANRESRTGMYGFESPTMQRIMASGLQAHNGGGWRTWVADYNADKHGIIANHNNAAKNLDLKTKLVDLTTTVGALELGKTYQLSYTPTKDIDNRDIPATDPACGNTYILSITLKSYTTGGGSGGGSSTKTDTTTTPVEETTTDKTTTVKEAVNGSATVVEKVAPGKTATVATKSNEGYVTSRVIVTDKDGNKVKVTYDGNGDYSFVMPEGGVTVTPVFRQKTEAPSETGVSAYLNVNDHILYMIGDDKGDFRPSDPVNRAEVAQMFYRLLLEKNVDTAESFSDVSDKAWYAEAVKTLASLGIINGVGNGTYEPLRAITRAEFTAICTRFAKAAVGSMHFTDVPESFWAYENIATAAQYGWIIGDGTGKFNPDANITRTEAATIVNRMLERLSDFDAIDDGEGRRFPDVSETFWGFYDITEATCGHDFGIDSERLHEAWQDSAWHN